MDSMKNREPASEQAGSAGAASADAAQFAAVLDSYEQRIYGYVLNRVRNIETANDLTQDVLSKAWASRATFDPEQDRLAWLIAIASNAIADHFKTLRAQKRHPVSGQMVPRADGHFAIGRTLDAAARSIVDPADKMIDAEEIAAADAAIARLDSSKRQAIEFRRSGLTYDEIAARMGVKNGTVGSLINRAIKELREMICGGSSD